MSKLLKVIVNTLLLLAILSAGALVIPPFAGITTLVSDGMGNTNISRGAVTYAKKTDTSSVATGDKILVDDNSGKYIYTIQSLDTAAGTASVKNVISGDTTEITVRATVSKVIVTIPVIGFLSMAAQSREGIMIIGLAILFLVILFILSVFFLIILFPDAVKILTPRESDLGREPRSLIAVEIIGQRRIVQRNARSSEQLDYAAQMICQLRHIA